MPLHHCVTTSLHKSVICLAPCHQTSQSFDLPPATKPVSHLPCPLPPRHCITASLCHCITALPHHCITASPHQSVICIAPCHQTSQSFDLPSTTASPRHHISQSFALPPATKPVSHLTCPLPLRHCVIASPHHHVTASLCQSVICLAPCHQASQSFALPPATKPVSHLTWPLPPHHHIIASPCHCVTASPRHHITASLCQ